MGFALSFSLSETHWLYEKDAEGLIGDPPKDGGPVAAYRWAIKAATDCGNILDFDPDAMVQNIIYALRWQAGEVGP